MSTGVHARSQQDRSDELLITGAAGFLGSALANRLAREGHQVRGLDDLSTGDPQALSRDVLFTRGDVNDRPKLWTLLQDVDCVYHLAARVSVPESVLYPREYNPVNVGGTVTLMEAMRDVGVRRVVFISSGAVYGDQGEQPLRESAIPNPRSPYAVSKLAAEYYVRTIGDLWGIETVACACSTPMGRASTCPPSHAPVIPYFLRQACATARWWCTATAPRPAIMSTWMMWCAAWLPPPRAPDVNQKIINVGSGNETSVRELVRLVHGCDRRQDPKWSTTRATKPASRACAPT